MRERTWFKLWVTEGYSNRQLTNISHRGIWKIKQVNALWLDRNPTRNISSPAEYLICDGTYFRHENCLLAVMDNANGQIINHRYCIRENYDNSYAILEGLNKPKAITIDGNTSIIRAINTLWPGTTIQRCLVHIQRQGLSWLRRNPQLPSAQSLRQLLLKVTNIETRIQQKTFIDQWHLWERHFGKNVIQLPSNHKVYGDLQRTRSLIIHALPDMFHYLDNRQIPPTTNKLEGYFSRLKMIYRQHRGLSKNNRPSYFNWYIYFKNIK